MELITKAHTEQLLANGCAQRAAIDQNKAALDFEPMVNLFTPDAQRTWLLTEIDADGLAFGLCDLGTRRRPLSPSMSERFVKLTR